MIYSWHVKQVVKQHVHCDDNLEKSNKHKQKNKRRIYINISQELLTSVCGLYMGFLFLYDFLIFYIEQVLFLK